MKYVPPVGGADNDPYVDGNPSTGVKGSPVPAAAIEDPMRELVALISDVGLTPDDADLTQVTSAVRMSIQRMAASSATAAGTADAITAVFTPAIAALTHGMTLHVRAAAANATTAPTFTPAAGTIAAKTIVKGNNLPLTVADIAGAGYWSELRYDQTLDVWVLCNPAKGVVTTQVKQLQSITAVVAANALTLGLQPTSLDFRASPLTNGAPNTRTIGAALSLVVPSGATLGTVSGQAARLVLLAIDNAGTVELAVANLAGGVNLDETTLISTTAISAAATSASTIYSTTARASVPFRVVGYIDITEAAAGTWATAPTVIQGQGGQALAALASIGYGQSWQNVTASRASGTIYYNTTGKPIFCSVNFYTGSNGGNVYFSVNGLEQSFQAVVSSASGKNVSFIVPPGASYSSRGDVSFSLVTWHELR